MLSIVNGHHWKYLRGQVICSDLYFTNGHHICTAYFKSVFSQSLLAKRELGTKAFCISSLLSASAVESSEHYALQPEQREKGFSRAMLLDQSSEDSKAGMTHTPLRSPSSYNQGKGC